MTSEEVKLIVGMAGVTFSIRYGILAISHRFHLPPRLLRSLSYLPPAVLMAIVAPAVFVDGDRLSVGLDNPRLVGALTALAIGLWRKNLLLTIGGGMGAFALWQVLGLAGR
ncbi:MAG: AzlD domain-containing protein [Cyanobacteria bacterium P01_E01_bin.34]